MNGEINKKVNKRKYITPNQNGRKSSLRYELEIKQIDEDNDDKLLYKSDSLDFFHSNDFDECELEIRNILFGLNSHSNSNSNDSNDSNENDIETEEIYHFERSKCPDLVF